MKKPLKIAIYSGDIPSTTFIERLIQGVSNSGTQVFLFGHLKHKPIYGEGVKVYGYKNTKGSKLWVLIKYTCLLFLFKPAQKKRLDAILKKTNKNTLYAKVKCYPVLWHQPDIFHVQWAKGLDEWMWVQAFGIKLVLSLRGSHINYSPIADQALAARYRQNFPKVDGFHAVSQAIAKEACKYGADKQHIQVVKSGLKLQDFLFQLKTTNPQTPINILSVGREHWVKNYRLALDAMHALKQLGLAFRYDIIGVSGEEALLFQRAQLGLEQEVGFIGPLPFKEVQKAIKEADVMLLPSVEEGIANVVLEAMALGTLVVCTDCGGMKEVVLPKQTGYLVPVRDAQAMALALKEVSELPLETYQRITQQARAFVEANHSEAQMVSGMLGLYKRLMLEGPDKVN